VFHFTEIINHQFERYLNAVDDDARRLPAFESRRGERLAKSRSLDTDSAVGVGTLKVVNTSVHIRRRRTTALAVGRK
jgi:hypothetical protein